MWVVWLNNLAIEGNISVLCFDEAIGVLPSGIAWMFVRRLFAHSWGRKARKRTPFRTWSDDPFLGILGPL